MCGCFCAFPSEHFDVFWMFYRSFKGFLGWNLPYFLDQIKGKAGNRLHSLTDNKKPMETHPQTTKPERTANFLGGENSWAYYAHFLSVYYYTANVQTIYVSKVYIAIQSIRL